MIDRLTDKLEDAVRRYDELTEMMGQPDVAGDYGKVQALAKERASLERVVGLYRNYKKTVAEIGETQTLLQERPDPELAAMAREEMESLTQRRDQLAQDIQVALLPADPNDEKSVIVEVRAGAGGDEAGLFAADLYRMYARYAASKNWRVDLLNHHETGIGGFKEVTFEIAGKGAYSRLKHESGVHRVQRVPETETSGRIHTSTATVAVLPEADEVDVDINPDDLRIDIFHSGGHGGQNVQKVATAVRIVHNPTGITAVCQDERSQLKNKQKAMAVLRARLLDMELRKQRDEITQRRRSQVGTADRSEKIRTYNFPQNRVTDHRLELSLHNLSDLLEGKEGTLDELIDALATREQAQRLEEAIT
ncbi:MAG: peptide chain release factor 1 [Dehalococcoidia bacterium]